MAVLFPQLGQLPPFTHCVTYHISQIQGSYQPAQCSEESRDESGDMGGEELMTVLL